MSRFSRKLALRMDKEQKSARKAGKYYSKKAIKGIAQLWADDNDELSTMCIIGARMMEDKHSYEKIRTLFLNREIEKCMHAGILENATNLLSMLNSKDKEFVEMGMAIVHTLRERRLHGRSR